MAAEITTLNTDVPEFFAEKGPSVAIVETAQRELPDVVEINKDVSEENWVYPYPTDFVLGDHPIDDVRELKVSTTLKEEDHTLLTSVRSL
jgi:hypothetical protein